jgi:hypothetical protein
LATLAIPDAKWPVVTLAAMAYLIVVRTGTVLPLPCVEHVFEDKVPAS